MRRGGEVGGKGRREARKEWGRELGICIIGFREGGG